ncbi:unnamed protein product [Peniophora sp. CBMAI 1063]|nr:unnamed protein product [Peniophora sp. CBMAI 1063]
MGQYWNLFNVDKRQKGKKVRGKFDDFIFSGHDWLVKLLARPEYSDAVPTLYSLIQTSNDRDQQGPLLNLPPELHAVIFAHLSSLDDAACLTVAHRLLAPEGYRRVAQLRREECTHWGSWAGDRIITAGDYIDELPENLLTPDEEAEMVIEGARFYNFAYHHYEGHAPLAFKPFLRIPPDAVGDHLRARLLLDSTSPRYPLHGTWVLCNISRKAYIRADALTTLDWQINCQIDGPFIRGTNAAVDLGTLVIMMTSCSDDLGDVGTAGPWAGDRLAVIGVEELEGEGWEDVSVMGLGVVRDCIVANERVM